MRILLTQLRRIGDVITTTPAVRATRFAWQNATIDFLTEPPSDEIYRYNPYIDNLITIGRHPSAKEFINLIKLLRKNKYDMLVDFFCNPTSAYISWLSGAKVKVGFDVRFRKYFYNYRVNTANFPPHAYAGMHKLALVAQIGVMPKGLQPEFFISNEAQNEADVFLQSLGVSKDDMLITLGIVTRHEFRQWPLERFAHTADYLIEKHNAKILFIYGKGEEDFPRKVQALMKNQALPEYEQGSLSRLRGIFGRAALHIGCDNGPANIAKASDIPTVILYSNSKASSWTPPGNDRFIGLEYDIDCKNNCLHEKCPDPLCIRNISVSEVIDNAEKIIKGLNK